MIQFEPLITLGPVIVWVTLMVLAGIVMIRLNKELRRADKVDAKLAALEEQVLALKKLLRDGPEEL